MAIISITINQCLLLAGVILIVINVGRIAYLAWFVSAIDTLWISQYVGIAGGLSIFLRLRNRALNGFYAYAFILPLVGLFTSSRTDVLFYLNHIPHFVGIAYLWHVGIPYSRMGQALGLAFTLTWFAMTFSVSIYFDALERDVNGVNDLRLLILLAILPLWFVVVDRLRVIKESRTR